MVASVLDDHLDLASQPQDASSLHAFSLKSSQGPKELQISLTGESVFMKSKANRMPSDIHILQKLKTTHLGCDHFSECRRTSVSEDVPCMCEE